MSPVPLTTYLNDHLAGGNAALELVEQLIEHMQDPDDQAELRQIEAEIAEDKSVLLAILKGSGGKESRVRSAAALIAQKIGQVKVALDDPDDGEFRNFEALEALALGIQGKAALWRALDEVKRSMPQLDRDYESLERRAQDQFDRVDRLRLSLAHKALSF